MAGESLSFQSCIQSYTYDLFKLCITDIPFETQNDSKNKSMDCSSHTRRAVVGSSGAYSADGGTFIAREGDVKHGRCYSASCIFLSQRDLALNGQTRICKVMIDNSRQQSHMLLKKSKLLTDTIQGLSMCHKKRLCLHTRRAIVESSSTCCAGGDSCIERQGDIRERRYSASSNEFI
jgi:hypothetical protein